MGLYNNFPYTNFHEINLDWLIKNMKQLMQDWDDFGADVSVSAFESDEATATVTGDLKTGLLFTFGLPRGADGEQGPAGPAGPQGPQGEPLKILGTYATLSDLQAAHPTGNVGDLYMVGSNNNFILYVWDSNTNAWTSIGSLSSPSAYDNAPLMDNIASAGISNLYARGDHVHPKDTSKQDVLVSGTNIKTINNTSLLGNGDISVQAVLVSGSNIKTINNNSVLGEGDITLQDVLVSGTNIKTINNISVLGSGDISVQEVLVSGTNIKTINNTSVLGSGDISVQPLLVSGTNIKTINNQSLLGSSDIPLPVVTYGTTEPSGTGKNGDIYIKLEA